MTEPLVKPTCFFEDLGAGACRLLTAGEPRKISFFEKTSQCETLCTSKEECEGYATVGSECILYTDGPLEADGEDNGGSGCKSKVSRSNAADGGTPPLAASEVASPAAHQTPSLPRPAMLSADAKKVDPATFDADAEKDTAALNEALTMAKTADGKIGDGIVALEGQLEAAGTGQVEIAHETEMLQEALLNAQKISKQCVRLAASMRAELAKCNDDRKALVNEYNALKNNLTATNAAIETADSMVNALEQQLAEAQAAKEQAEEELAQLQEEFDLAQKAADKSSAEVSALRKQIAATKAQTAKLSSDLQKEIDAYNAATAQARARYETASKELVDGKKENKILQAKRVQVQGEMTAAQQAEKQLRTEITKLETEIQDTKDAADKLATELDAEIQAAQQIVDEEQRSVSELEAELTRLKREVAALRAKNNDLTTQLEAARRAAKILGEYRSE